jgi:hypothetical protein
MVSSRQNFLAGGGTRVCSVLFAGWMGACGAPVPLDIEEPDASQMNSTNPVRIDPPTTTPSCMSDQMFVGRVRGTVVNFDGTPHRNGNVTVCGSTCYPGVSDADGRFEVAINRCFSGTAEYIHGVAFSFDGLNRHTDIFFDFNSDNNTRMGTVTIVRPLYVGNYNNGGFAAAPTTNTSSLMISDGLGFVLRFTPGAIEYPLTAEQEEVRVVRIPVSKLPPYADRPLAVAYSISPSESVLRTPASVEFPNVLGIPGGTEVEIVAVGNHATNCRPAVGVLGRVDMGRVSADGRRVIANTGLRAFGTVGYRTVQR